MSLRYVVLRNNTLELLQADVNRAIRQDSLRPLGGVLFDGKQYIQAMIGD
jgi:hypothetical protein